MKTIAIKDITESTVDALSTRIPVLPAGLSSFRCTNGQTLMAWKRKFIELYGDEGELHLDWSIGSQIDGNSNYDKACLATADRIY